MQTIIKRGLLSLIILFFLPCTGDALIKKHPVDCTNMVRSYRLIKLHYENSNGEKGITIYEYDTDGIAQTATWKLLDGSRYSRNYHTYDHSGNLVRKYREFSDGLTSNTIYEYEPIDPGKSLSFTSSNVFITNTIEFRVVKETFGFEYKKI